MTTGYSSTKILQYKCVEKEVKMSPITIEIYDEEVVSYLTKVFSKFGVSPVEWVTREVKKYIAEDAKIDKTNPIKRMTFELQNEYNNAYREKFGTEPAPENGEGLKAISEIVEFAFEKDPNYENNFKVFSRAINWYINYHNNSDAQGQNFPYGVKYLFNKNNGWLLRTCIESSLKLDDKVFQLMKERNLTKDEAIRLLRRGDAAGSDIQNSVITTLDEALLVYTRVKNKMNNPKIKNALKTLPEIELLFKSETPSIEYIKNSIEFLQKVEEKIENER